MRFPHLHTLKVCAVAALLSACEAPLDLSGVEQSKQQSILRTDMFQSGAATAERSVLVSSTGAALHRSNQADQWQRTDLPGRPSLIDATACDNGDVVALDAEHRIWHLAAGQDEWQAHPIDTPEPTLVLSCAPDNVIWVGGGFSSLWSSVDFGQSWRAFSMQEDLQFTAISFVNAALGFAAGEFGTVVKTIDGGKTWERAGDLPNEFYPMDMVFADESNAWVVGLNGIVWHSKDGANTWQKESTPVKASLYALSERDGQLIAVGDGGTVLTRQAGVWSALELPAALTYLLAVAVTPNRRLIAAGGAGTVINHTLAATPTE